MEQLEKDINSACIVYEHYLEKTKEISILLKVADSQKDFVASIGKISNFQDFIDGLETLSNSTVLYNAAVISIYGSYELFLDEIGKTYIAYLKRKNPLYEELPKKLKDKNLSKSAEYLSNPQRFQNLGIDRNSIIIALESSHIQNQSVHLLDKLLLSHSGNIKTKQLNAFLEELGFIDPLNHLAKHHIFKEKDQSNNNYKTGEGGSSLFQQLDRIVEERNIVAHGWIVDERLAYSLLLDEYLPFFESLCLSIRDLFVSRMIQDSIEIRELEQFGSIIHVWENGNIIGINNKDFRLKVGDILYYSTGNDWYYTLPVLQLQINRKDRKEIRVRNRDITIRTNKKIKENHIIWGYRNRY